MPKIIDGVAHPEALDPYALSLAVRAAGIRVKIVVDTEHPGVEGHPIAIAWFGDLVRKLIAEEATPEAPVARASSLGPSRS